MPFWHGHREIPGQDGSDLAPRHLSDLRISFPSCLLSHLLQPRWPPVPGTHQARSPLRAITRVVTSTKEAIP